MDEKLEKILNNVEKCACCFELAQRIRAEYERDKLQAFIKRARKESILADLSGTMLGFDDVKVRSVIIVPYWFMRDE